MSSRTAIAALLVLAGLLVWWLGRSPDPAADRAPEPPTEASAATEPATLLAASAEPESSRVESVPPPAEERAPPGLADAPAEEAAPLEQPDLDARDWLEVLVQDEQGHAVFDAELAISGVRKKGNRGSWYQMRDGPTHARSDAAGRAHIEHVRWVDIDGRTIEVDLQVSHPDFVPFRDSRFEIGPGEHVVTMRRGSTVVVSAWFGSLDRIVTDVELHVDGDSRLEPDAWTREHDGRLSTGRLSPGEHWIEAVHESDALGRLSSGFVSFSLAENEWKELDLELLPGRRLAGRLEDVVPRPVVDGHVLLCLQAGSHRGGPSIDRRFEAAVHADGTFVIEDLPPGDGQIVALCDGWSSRRARARSLEEAGIGTTGEPDAEEVERLLQRAGPNALIEQRVAVPSSAPIVVLMERTGALEVTLHTLDGAPVTGGFVSTSPNYHFLGVGSSIVPWRQWYAVTDPSGVATVTNLPPTDHLFVLAQHERLRMTRADRTTYPHAEIRPGETTHLELALEPKQE